MTGLWRLAGVVLVAVFALSKLTEKKRIFVSYYYKGDNKYKNMLKAWSANDKFDFDFEDVSADVSIRSRDSDRIRGVLTEKIRKADVVLVLVGEKTHRRKWVKWEISAAKKNRKPLVAVKVDPSYVSPRPLLSSGATWARSFEFESIKKALADADSWLS